MLFVVLNMKDRIVANKYCDKILSKRKKINKWGFLIYEEMKKKPCKLIYNSAMCFLDTLKFWIKFYARPH